MIKREQLIKSYFQSWINKDNELLSKIFDPYIVYTESYGPEYHGLHTIEKWFEDWNLQGTVLIWDIKQFIHQGNMTVVEWYFKCEFESEFGEFDGISLIEFNNKNLVVNLKEFQSKKLHHYPYE